MSNLYQGKLDDYQNSNLANSSQMADMGSFYPGMETGYNNMLDWQGNEASAIADWRGSAPTDLNQARDVYSGMVSDPNKRGYGGDWVRGQFGKLADTATGERQNFMKTAGQAAAAGGMSNTGSAMRQALQFNKTKGQQLLGAQNDVNLKNAEAQRDDLWGATKGLMDVQGARDKRDVTGFDLMDKNYTAQRNTMADKYANQQGREGNLVKANSILNQNPALMAAQNQSDLSGFGRSLPGMLVQGAMGAAAAYAGRP